jgi:ribonuclease BN (tRNA processing enzyme)
MPYQVYHDGTAPFFALRVELDGRVVSYSGDSEWCDALADAGRDADLFICEAYTYDKTMKTHLDLKTLEMHLDEIHPKRLVLTYLSPDMLARVATIGYEVAEDGKLLEC